MYNDIQTSNLLLFEKNRWNSRHFTVSFCTQSTEVGSNNLSFLHMFSNINIMFSNIKSIINQTKCQYQTLKHHSISFRFCGHHHNWLTYNSILWSLLSFCNNFGNYEDKIKDVKGFIANQFYFHQKIDLQNTESGESKFILSHF